jgi:hypothetical protein
MTARKRHHKSCKLLLVLGLLLGLSGGHTLLCAEEVSQEYQLKAAFLVNFIRFISWPEQSFAEGQREIDLCIVGRNPFGAMLHAVESKKIEGRNIKVVEIESFGPSSRCHMLFVSKSDRNEVEAVLSRSKQKPVVTVSDFPGFAMAGGSIEFVTKDDRLSFIVNNSALKLLGIEASASMLDLAASVR